MKLAAMLPGHEDVTQRVGSAIGLIDESFSAEETFWAIRRALEISAERRPLVVLVDDIHWAERTLLDLLRFVVEECHAPVLLLCSSRRELLEEHPEWDVRPRSLQHADRRTARRGRERARDAEPARRDRPGRHDRGTRDRRRRREPAVPGADAPDADRPRGDPPRGRPMGHDGGALERRDPADDRGAPDGASGSTRPLGANRDRAGRGGRTGLLPRRDRGAGAAARAARGGAVPEDAHDQGADRPARRHDDRRGERSSSSTR